MADKKKRGFAALSPDRQREIASKGGHAVHKKGKAYQWDSKSGADAGRKGGMASRGGRRSILEPESKEDTNG